MHLQAHQAQCQGFAQPNASGYGRLFGVETSHSRQGVNLGGAFERSPLSHECQGEEDIALCFEEFRLGALHCEQETCLTLVQAEGFQHAERLVMTVKVEAELGHCVAVASVEEVFMFGHSAAPGGYKISSA